VPFVPFLRVVAFPTILPSLHLRCLLPSSFLLFYSLPLLSFSLALTFKCRGFHLNPSFRAIPQQTVNANCPIVACHPLYLKAPLTVYIHNFAIVLLVPRKLKRQVALVFSPTHCQIVVVTLIQSVRNINQRFYAKLATDRHSVLYSLS